LPSDGIVLSKIGKLHYLILLFYFQVALLTNLFTLYTKFRTLSSVLEELLLALINSFGISVSQEETRHNAPKISPDH
jgi:hypothetical protein